MMTNNFFYMCFTMTFILTISCIISYFALTNKPNYQPISGSLTVDIILFTFGISTNLFFFFGIISIVIVNIVNKQNNLVRVRPVDQFS